MWLSRRVVRFGKIGAALFLVFLAVQLIYRQDESAPQLELLDQSHELFNGPNASDALKREYAGVLSMNASPNFESPLDPKTIVESIEFLNSHYTVRNTAKFGAVSADSVSVVIVVQVHNRKDYLASLIDNLKNARGIEQALVVFSHDMSASEINNVVNGIEFCRVIQIFYPHNIQLFPNKFPGQDPRDCAERISKTEAELIRCQNYKETDKYGHYRVGKLTQIKHHWWWKMNYVFDGIIKKYGLNDTFALMLEEDHFVAPDALHVLDLMMKTKDTVCPECEVLSIGFYLKNFNTYGMDINRLSVQKWFSSRHNMGFAISLKTWEAIRNCSELFCKYDDYNWDWSLLQVSLKCMKPAMKVIQAKAPRVLHVGDCGVHTHRCQVHNALNNARALFRAHADKLFPSQMLRTEVSKRSLKPSKPNGGWGDSRDHQLCMNNSFPYHSPQPRGADNPTN